MIDFVCHRIEVLLNILGPVKRTAGFIGNVIFDREVEDNSAALFHFERGAFGVLCVSNSIFEPGDTLDVYGSKGSIHIPVLNRGSMVIKTEEGERSEEHPPTPQPNQLPLPRP